jgi:hypothetical protein
MWTSSPRSGIRSTGIRTLVFRTEGLDAAEVEDAFAFGESEGGVKRKNAHILQRFIVYSRRNPLNLN